MQPTNTNDKASAVSPAISDFAKDHGYETAEYNRRWGNFKCYEPILHKGRAACIGLPRMILEDVKTGAIRMSTAQEAMTILWDTQNAANDTTDDKTVNDGANNDKNANDSTDNNASDDKDTDTADNAADEVSPAVLDFAKDHGYETAEYRRRWRTFKCYEAILHKGVVCFTGYPLIILEDVKTGDIRMSTARESFDIIDESRRARINKSNIKQVEQLVEQAWPTATTEKREKLVQLMVAFESPKWDEYLFAAEKNQIAGSDVLLKHKAELVDAGARGIADHDGTMLANFDTDYYQRQVEALLDYLE